MDDQELQMTNVKVLEPIICIINYKPPELIEVWGQEKRANTIYSNFPNGPLGYNNFNGLTGFQDAVKNHDQVGLKQVAQFYKQAFK